MLTSNDIPRLILITDPGRDADDTLALLALHGCGVSWGGFDFSSAAPAAAAAAAAGSTVCVSGIVASGGNAAARAELTRRWLRAIAGPDTTTPIVACPDVAGIGREECAMPACLDRYASPPRAAPELPDQGCTPAAWSASTELLLSALEAGPTAIVAIAPLTPIALALAEAGERFRHAFARHCSGFFIQGQALVSKTEPVVALPDPAAFNMREDMAAASAAMSLAQAAAVPVHLLGKYAAYAVGVRRTHLESVDRVLAARIGHAAVVPIAAQVMDVFRCGNPDLFDTLYPGIPADALAAPAGDTRWFDFVDVCSHPYDPLLVLMAVGNLQRRVADASSGVPSSSSSSSSFRPRPLSTVLKSPVFVVGATPDDVGLDMAGSGTAAVPEPRVLADLVQALHAGAARGD